MRSANCRSLPLIVILGGCLSKGSSRLPNPDTLVHCFTLRAAAPSNAHLPRALNLGILKRNQLHLGILVPDSADMRALWRLVPPDSLIVDFVPAATGMGILNGTRLRLRLSEPIAQGKAVFWSDEVGSEQSVPVIGTSVPCPAGA